MDVDRMIDMLQAFEKFVAVKEFGDGSAFKVRRLSSLMVCAEDDCSICRWTGCEGMCMWGEAVTLWAQSASRQ